MRTRPGWWVAAGLLLILAGCGSDASPTYDEDLSTALLEACEGPDEVQLAELTDFEWDTVYVFAPYTTGRMVNESVGQDVVATDYQHTSDSENVLIFLEGGSLAHAATVRRVGIGPGSGQHLVTANAETWLVPADPDGGAWYPCQDLREH